MVHALSFGLLVLAIPQSELASRIENYVKPLSDHGYLSGSLLVAKGDEILFEGHYGMAEHENRIANGPDTRYCVASITKPMTIAVVIQMLTEKKMGLEDPISKFIPDFPNGGNITINHLLNHRAGIPHRVTTELEESKPMTPEQMVEKVKKAAPLGPPGANSVYSSSGFTTLARIVEIVEKKPFQDVLSERIFGPLGMKNSVDPKPFQLIPNRAWSYFVSPAGSWPAALKDYTFLTGAGSVYSNAKDLHRYLRGVVNGKLGESVKANILSREKLSWAGITNNFQSFLDYDRESQVTVIFTGNMMTGANDMIRAAIPQVVEGKTLTPQIPEIKSFPIAEADLKKFVGTYAMSRGGEAEVELMNGYLIFGDSVMIPKSETSFFTVRDFGEVRVTKNPDGSPKELAWIYQGQPFLTATPKKKEK